MSSHSVVQQKSSRLHTVSTHASQPGVSAAPVVQMSCSHDPPPPPQFGLQAPASCTHCASHWVVQQKSSPAHTCDTQALQEASSAPPSVHSSCVQLPPQEPQSAGQDAHVSLPSQEASPHTGEHAPQSAAHVAQDSPMSH